MHGSLDLHRLHIPATYQNNLLTAAAIRNKKKEHRLLPLTADTLSRRQQKQTNREGGASSAAARSKAAGCRQQYSHTTRCARARSRHTVAANNRAHSIPPRRELCLYLFSSLEREALFTFFFKPLALLLTKKRIISTRPASRLASRYISKSCISARACVCE